MSIWEMIWQNAMPILISAISGILGYVIKSLKKQKAAQEEAEQKRQKDNETMSNGVRCLLRANIVSDYNKYTDRGYCPIYAKESLKQSYSAYHDLGGNDVATELYHKLLAMPEEKESEE